MSLFKRAERKRVFIKLAITGPTGSGKTYSALRLAFGLGARVAVIDTENSSAELYADLGEFDHLDIRPPFTAQKYIEAIRAAEAEAYDVVIIDSLSHAWAGEGGLLDQKSAKDMRGGNGFSNWAEITRLHEQLKGALLQSRVHVVATMRSKMEHVQEVRDGKTQIRKVGLAPVQRDDMPYEFTVVFDVDATHTATTDKDRTGLFTDQVAQITEDHGRRIAAWLESGKEPDPEPEPAPAAPAPAPAQVDNVPAAMQAGQSATAHKRLQYDYLVKTKGFKADPKDLVAMAARIGELLGRPDLRAEELKALTGDDLKAARAELEARNAARARAFAVLDEYSFANLPDEARHRLTSEILGISVTSWSQLTAAELNRFIAGIPDYPTAVKAVKAESAPQIAEITPVPEDQDPFAGPDDDGTNEPPPPPAAAPAPSVDGSSSDGVWPGPGQCPQCHAPEGKWHGKPCRTDPPPRPARTPRPDRAGKTLKRQALAAT